jgi:hypothetical protein
MHLKTISDIFVTWYSVLNKESNISDRITENINNLIKYTDGDDDTENIIELLIDLKVNEEDHKYDKKVLLTRIDELDRIIELLINEEDIDLRKYNTNITDEDWDFITLKRRRKQKLNEIRNI